MNKQLEATAYHEAGHAFADSVFGFRIKRASIVPNEKDGSAGHVKTKSGLHFRSLEYTTPSGARIGRLHERIVSMMAGIAAQRRFSPRSVRSFHARGDYENAALILERIHSPNEIQHVWRYLEEKTKHLIEIPQFWFVIGHLAKALLKHTIMTGEQVDATIREGRQLYFKRKETN